jgi:thioredoxin reductase (NADPH)
MESLSTDVAIIGAGPIGIELAVALKRTGVDYQHFDAKQIGFTISWFAPQTKFFSSNERIAIAGVPLMTADQSKATREEYLAYLRSVVTQFNLKIHTYEPLGEIAGREGDFKLTTHASRGERVTHAKKIILVTGGTDHPRRMGIPGEDLPHVSAYFRDPHTYFGKRLLIVGGKNSAVEAALRCYNAGAIISMCYRREMFPEKSIKYWLLPEINGLIQSGKITGHFLTSPTKITPSHVTLCRKNETFDIEADFVLSLIGYAQDNALFKLAGVELVGDCGAPKFDEQTMETNVPGIYVAGTAVGGTQDKYRVFIENCHVHVDRIIAAITGAKPPAAPVEYARPES